MDQPSGRPRPADDQGDDVAPAVETTGLTKRFPGG